MSELLENQFRTQGFDNVDIIIDINSPYFSNSSITIDFAFALTQSPSLVGAMRSIYEDRDNNLSLRIVTDINQMPPSSTRSRAMDGESIVEYTDHHSTPGGAIFVYLNPYFKAVSEQSGDTIPTSMNLFHGLIHAHPDAPDRIPFFAPDRQEDWVVELENQIAVELEQEVVPTRGIRLEPYSGGEASPTLGPGCFLAGTPITMANGSTKPIETIQADDQVASYDRSGNLVPRKVTRTFQPQVKYILDVHGLMVTPGHVTLCGDGKFAGQHVPMIDILRSDGALVRESGELVRACTNELVGSDRDRFIHAFTGERQPDGSVRVLEAGLIRLGTRYITDDCYDVSVADVIAAAGGTVSADGLILRTDATQGVPFLWPFGSRLPRPEDYVLQRSALGLNDIYQAAEWEAVPPRMPKPDVKEDAARSPAGDAIYLQ